MFEALLARAERRARRRARALSAELAARIEGERLAGVTVEAEEAGVRLGGRGLGRRFALEPALRWLNLGWGRWR
jgi:hypothetical protein